MRYIVLEHREAVKLRLSLIEAYVWGFFKSRDYEFFNKAQIQQNLPLITARELYESLDVLVNKNLIAFRDGKYTL
jgi:hypothetical protein